MDTTVKLLAAEYGDEALALAQGMAPENVYHFALGAEILEERVSLKIRVPNHGDANTSEEAAMRALESLFRSAAVALQSRMRGE